MKSQRFSRARSYLADGRALPARIVTGRRTRIAGAIIACGTIAGTFAAVVPASATTTTTLKVSASADRQDANVLAGQGLAGARYVFVDAPSSAKVRTVDFYLDGTQVSHEKSAPYDMYGGTTSAANPLDLSRIAWGKHTIKATVKTAYKTEYLSGTLVNNTGAPSLVVSADADRSGATTLDGQTLSGLSYVSVTTSTGVSSVDFYLDGTQVSHEKTAPYDMYGGTSDAANPLDVTKLVDGTHTVAANVNTSGGTLKLSGTFMANSTTTAVSTQPAPTPTASQSPTASASPTASPSPSSPSGSTSPDGAGTAFDPLSFDWSSVGGPAGSTGGNVTLSTDGASISECNVGSVHADANNVSVSTCTVNGGVFGAGSYTVSHNFITSDSDGMDPTGPGYKVIEYNKIWRDGTRVGTKHEDGIQFWQGGNALVRRNWISGWQTSAMMVKADLGTISHLTIDSNYLNNPTGYYQLYLCHASHDLQYITVTNNAFGKASFTTSTCGDHLTFVHTEEQRQTAIAAGNKAAASWIVWNNNYLATTGAVVAPPGGWAE